MIIKFFKIIILINLVISMNNNLQAEQLSSLRCIERYQKIAIDLGGSSKYLLMAGGAATLLAAIGPLFIIPAALAGITGAVTIGLAKSYRKTYVLLGETLSLQRGEIEPDDTFFKSVKFAKKNKKDPLKMAQYLWSPKGMSRWCTHPLWDYFRLKRAIKRGAR